MLDESKSTKLYNLREFRRQSRKCRSNFTVTFFSSFFFLFLLRVISFVSLNNEVKLHAQERAVPGGERREGRERGGGGPHPLRLGRGGGGIGMSWVIVEKEEEVEMVVM